MARYRLLALLIISFLIFTLPSFSLAAEEVQPELKFDKVETTTFAEMSVDGIEGATETITREGQVFAAVRLVLTPQWTEETKRLNIKSDDIKLTAPDGWETTMIGYFDRYGQFVLRTRNLGSSRPSQWKEKPQEVIYNAVFAVPKGQTDFELKLGAAATKISVPAETAPMPDPGDTVTIEILSAKFVDQVVNENKVGALEPKPQSVITNPNGSILEVTINLTPKMGNSLTNPNHFFWHTPWMGVLSSQGGYYQTFGEMFGKNVSNNVSHNISSSNQKWISREAVLYFMVPEDFKAFKLIYVNTPVAEGEVK